MRKRREAGEAYAMKPAQNERGAREGGPRQPGTISGSLFELGVRTDGGIPEAGAPFITMNACFDAIPRATFMDFEMLLPL